MSILVAYDSRLIDAVLFDKDEYGDATFTRIEGNNGALWLPEGGDEAPDSVVRPPELENL